MGSEKSDSGDEMNYRKLSISLLLCLIPMLPYAPGVLVALASERSIIRVTSISIEEFTPRRSQWPVQRIKINRIEGAKASSCKLFLFDGNDIPKRMAGSMEILQKKPPFQVSGRVSALGGDHCWIYTDLEMLRLPLVFCLLIFVAAWRFSSVWMKSR